MRARFAVFTHHTEIPRAVAVGDWNERLLICKEGILVYGRRRQGRSIPHCPALLSCLVSVLSMQFWRSNSFEESGIKFLQHQWKWYILVKYCNDRLKALSPRGISPGMVGPWRCSAALTSSKGLLEGGKILECRLIWVSWVSGVHHLLQ